MNKWMKIVYFAAGAACIGYYFVIGMASRFGLSMSGMWIAFGCAFIIAGIFAGSRKVPRWMHIAWREALCLGILCVIVLECFVVSGMMKTAPANMDYLIVLGARVDPDGPSPALKRRLNAAMEYLEESPDTIIIASGGQGEDERMSEGRCIYEELVKRGIAPERILVEERSTSTAENIAFSMALMDDTAADVGMITNNYHVFRAERIARAAGLENVRGIAAKYTGYTLFHYMIREAACIVLDFLRGNL